MVFVRHSRGFAKDTLMLISRHATALFVPLRDPHPRQTTIASSFSWLGLNSAHSAQTDLRLNLSTFFQFQGQQLPPPSIGVQRQLCILSQLWDAECSLSCFVLTASSMHFA